MKLSQHKVFKLFKPRTKYPCRQCKCSYPIEGDTYIYTKRAIPAVDGKKAFRIFWICHSGHRIDRGYTKPVSWKKNLGGDMTIDDGKSFRDEDEEIEKEYQEMLDYARRMSNGGSGKRYF